MDKIILKYVLQNAVKFNGKANPKAILGKVLQEREDLRNHMEDVKKHIDKIVKEVNALSLDEQKKRLESLAPELLEKKEIVEKRLPELKGVRKNPVFRFEPSPSGPMHIGHIVTFLLNSEYVKKYKGKLILRLADTDPDNIYVPAYRMLVEDAKWLAGINFKTYTQSDRMDLYYMYAVRLINDGYAYVCKCSQEEFKVCVDEKEGCRCRGKDVEHNLIEWRKMLEHYNDGDAVLRLKTDMQHKNPAIRDFALFRINTSEHPRQGKKYRVWPLYNFSVAIDDMEMGVSYIIRGKDHTVNTDRQKWLYEYLQRDLPIFHHIGRINFTGLRVSASETRRLIEEGKYSDWDDIRLPFVRAYKKKGISREAFVKYVYELGPSKTDKVVDYEDFIKKIYAFNKEVIDRKANRYFVIFDKKKIKIKNAPKMRVKAPLHPEISRWLARKRKFKTSDEFYVDDDIDNRKMYRFMHLFNFKNKSFVGKDFDAKLNAVLIDWLPVSDDLVNVEVVMPSNEIKKGIGESNLRKVKEGEIVQFERKFFARCVRKEKEKLIFYFTHK
jgi:glutamyl-tRNA synthetase